MNEKESFVVRLDINGDEVEGEPDEGDRFEAFLKRNGGKRIRVTCEVLEDGTAD